MDNNTTGVSKVRGADLFLQLGAFGSLYACIIALLILLFRVIDNAFPPIMSSAYSRIYSSSTISFQVATLIVFFPVYILLSWFLQKIYAADPSRRETRVRRGLIYFTLFVSGMTMAGDLVSIIYSFLNGDDITTGFILKVLSVLVVFGCVFVYYLQDVRNKLTLQSRNILRLIAFLIVLISIAWGFFVVGSPRTQKHIKQDQQRIMDLQTIQNNIINYYQSKGTLPTALTDLNDSLSYYNVPLDPQTQQNYEYARTGSLTFDICANFQENAPSNSQALYIYGTGANSNWQYSSGHYCFHRSLDPQLYRPKPAISPTVLE